MCIRDSLIPPARCDRGLLEVCNARRLKIPEEDNVVHVTVRIHLSPGYWYLYHHRASLPHPPTLPCPVQPPAQTWPPQTSTRPARSPRSAQVGLLENERRQKRPCTLHTCHRSPRCLRHHGS